MSNLDDLFECPRCGGIYARYQAALSRHDNKTAVCSLCGTAEALEDAGYNEPYDGEPYWQEGEENEEVHITIDSETDT